MAGHADEARMITFPDGARYPALGLGTWHMGESKSTRAKEVAAIQTALEIGYRVIDTAEMYGSGGAEEVVGEALRDALRNNVVRREELFIVSKVLPLNASRRGTATACEATLRRTGLGHIDLYLLHWRGAYALSESVEAFEALRARGLIKRWGVSNFDTTDMQELFQTPGGTACAANQVCYSLSERGIEWDLLQWQAERGVPTMAYCPMGQGTLAGHPELQELARGIGCTAAQLALAFTLRNPQVMPIPKAGREVHLRENFAAAQLRLDAKTLAALDRLFPPPRQRERLAMT